MKSITNYPDELKNKTESDFKSAELLGVTSKTISNWSKGKTKPPKAVFLYLSLIKGDLSHVEKQWRVLKLSHGGGIPRG